MDDIVDGLENLGFDRAFIQSQFPEWWVNDAVDSPSAVLQLKLALAKTFNIDPVSLISDHTSPQFLDQAEQKFKGAERGKEANMRAISAFGSAMARYLVIGTKDFALPDDLTASTIRNSILKSERWVSLEGLLSFCWAVGIPVMHLKNRPLRFNAVSGMTVRIGDRFAILLARNETHPSWQAFILAHEIAHIIKKHLHAQGIIVDFEILPSDGLDDEEKEANDSALEMLTGQYGLRFDRQGDGGSVRELLTYALNLSREYQIDPGHILLNYAFNTQEWGIARAALNRISDRAFSAPDKINQICLEQLDLRELQASSLKLLKEIMGLAE